MEKLIQPFTQAQFRVLALVRIITGCLMAYHGLEVFHRTKMVEYAAWESIKNLPASLYLVYIGKGLEFITGLCFVFGIFTRLAAFFMAVNMLSICFNIGNGKFWYEDQHPFLFVLLSVVFFILGDGVWSLKSIIIKKDSKNVVREI